MGPLHRCVEGKNNKCHGDTSHCLARNSSICVLGHTSGLTYMVYPGSDSIFAAVRLQSVEWLKHTLWAVGEVTEYLLSRNGCLNLHESAENDEQEDEYNVDNNDVLDKQDDKTEKDEEDNDGKDMRRRTTMEKDEGKRIMRI